jgi:uroporphyrinogen-III synthase
LEADEAMIINRGSIIVLVGLLLSQATGFASSSSCIGRSGSSLLSQQVSSNGDKDDVPVVIALTREEGNNEKLRQQLIQQLQAANKLDSVEIVELPCIAHADGPDYDKLQNTLTSQCWDYVTITSPEAARVLASAWSFDAFVNHPIPAVAAVGKATEDALKEAGIPVAFCPSKATAKVLVQELPKNQAAATVLYPASARAETTLQDGLAERDFAVTRLNTYDTVTATWTDEQKSKAAQAKIVCVASPSSIKGWLANTHGEPAFLVACIGETSAQACRKLGIAEDQIFFPEKPGIPGWADSIQYALESLSASSSDSSAFNHDPAMTATD